MPLAIRPTLAYHADWCSKKEKKRWCGRAALGPGFVRTVARSDHSACPATSSSVLSRLPKRTLASSSQSSRNILGCDVYCHRRTPLGGTSGVAWYPQ
jgi:hypothetical protein